MGSHLDLTLFCWIRRINCTKVLDISCSTSLCVGFLFFCWALLSAPPPTALFHKQLCHTQLFHTQPPVTRNFVTHTHTHNSFTRNLLSRATLSHTHTTLSHTTRDSLTCYFSLASVALGDIGVVFAWQAWQLSHRRCLCVAGLAFGDMCFTFVWQAWHLVTSTVLLCGRRKADFHLSTHCSAVTCHCVTLHPLKPQFSSLCCCRVPLRLHPAHVPVAGSKTVVLMQCAKKQPFASAGHL